MKRGMALAIVAGMGLAWTWAAEAPPPGAKATVYLIQTTSDLTLALPCKDGTAQIRYRSTDGQWKPADVTKTGEVAQIRVATDQIAAGRTLILVGVPADTDLSDDAPPHLVSCRVDDRVVTPPGPVDLGGVDRPPETIRLEIQDEKNRLDPQSAHVTVNGHDIALPGPGARLTFPTPKSATIELAVASLIPSVSQSNTIAVRLDDVAPDENEFAWSLSFRCAPTHRLPDGTVLSVDTVTGSAGWEKWAVIADGVKMDDSMGTTAGRTWLSEESGTPHWVRWQFPQPRAVAGVALWWAFYECYRTSTTYDVQTWDGQKWVTQVTVKDQGSMQCSRHPFGPVTTTSLRVLQPPGGGHPGRAGYMWLSEAEVQ